MLAKLDDCLARRGLKPTGPSSGIYYNTPKEVDSQELVWEVFRPVEFETPESLEVREGFGIRKILTRRVATIVHRGPYRRAGASYQRLEEWLKQQGLEVCGPAEETYISGIISPDQAQILEIQLPVCPA